MHQLSPPKKILYTPVSVGNGIDMILITCTLVSFDFLVFRHRGEYFLLAAKLYNL